MPTLQLPQRFKNSPFNSDYFKILGVMPTANADEIKQAFKKRALEYHPDHAIKNNLSMHEATQCMQVLVEIQVILLSNCRYMDDQVRAVVIDKQFTPEEELAALMLNYLRSARFFEYQDNKGPGVPGYWCLIPGGSQNVEIGTSFSSKKTAIANDQYHVERGMKFNTPLSVYSKSNQPFTEIVDSEIRQAVLWQLAECIPEINRKHVTKLYGEFVVQKPAVMPSGSGFFAGGHLSLDFRIPDASGDNFATGVALSKDGDGYIISGKNNKGEARAIWVHADGGITGFNGCELGYVETQLARYKDRILSHFKFVPAVVLGQRPSIC